MHYDVFISYSRKDYVDKNSNVIPNNPVSAIKDSLRDAGISYWFDKEGVHVGDTFAKKIARSIEQSDILIFISSKNSNKSDYTSKEIALAVKKRKCIIPVLIDESEYASDVSLYLSNINHLNYYLNPQKGLVDLVNSVKLHLQAQRGDKELIAELEAECKELNKEESNIEQRREELLAASMNIIDENQRAKIQSFIKESSPIRIKNIEEQNIVQEQDSLNPPFKKLNTWLQNFVAGVKSKSSSFFKHSFSQFRSILSAGLGSSKDVFNKFWAFVSNLFSKTKTIVNGVYKKLSLKSLLWFLIILAVVLISYNSWNHRSTIHKYIDDMFTSKVDSMETENKPYQYGIDLFMDSICDIIDLMQIEDPQFAEYYQGFKNNDLYSTYKLGKWLEGKESNTKEPTIAAKLVRRAAERGYADAQITLGFYYFFHKEGLPINYDEAITWYMQAEEQGSIYAKYYLGYAYMHGGYKGTKTAASNKSLIETEALPRLEESANHGYARSMYELGIYYMNNKKEYSEAFMYFKSAYDTHIQNGEDPTKRLQTDEAKDCVRIISQCYRTGRGVEKDLEEANKWSKIKEQL